MTIFDILKAGIELGIENDFRQRKAVLSYSWTEKISTNKGRELINPYADTGIVSANNLELPVECVAVGIDIGQDEILTVQAWEERTGKKVDLFISHHPRGYPAGTFPSILKTQLGNLGSFGIKTAELEKYFDRQTKTMQRSNLEPNFGRTYSTVKLLEKNYIALHTPMDNISARLVAKEIDESGAKTLAECMNALKKIPEYQIVAKEFGVHPVILSGKPEDDIGKLLSVASGRARRIFAP